MNSLPIFINVLFFRPLPRFFPSLHPPHRINIIVVVVNSKIFEVVGPLSNKFSGVEHI